MKNLRSLLVNTAVVLPRKTIRTVGMASVIASGLTGMSVSYLHQASQAEQMVRIAAAFSDYTRIVNASAIARDAAYVLVQGKVQGIDLVSEETQRLTTTAGDVELANPWKEPHRFEAASATWTLAVPEKACPSVLRALPPNMLASVGTGSDIDNVRDWSAPPSSPEAASLRCSGVGAVALRFATKS